MALRSIETARERSGCTAFARLAQDLRYSHSSGINPAPRPWPSSAFSYWHDRFAADLAVVGQTIRIGRLPFTICEVAAPEILRHRSRFRSAL
jgi:hypothetical protein